MSSVSTIPQSLVQAYFETHFEVHGDTPTVLKIGEANPQLAVMHADAGANCSAFITAWNPFSVEQPPARNLALQESLEGELAERGLHWIKGIGRHPSGNCPGEESLLVVGLTADDAKALGTAFGQNAIVWSSSDAVPQLLLLA